MSAGIDARNCRSCAGSPHLLDEQAGDRGGPGPLQEPLRARAASAAENSSRPAASRSSAIGAARRQRRDHRHPAGAAPAASSSSVWAKTCSLRKHCRASAQQRSRISSSSHRHVRVAATQLEHREPQRGQEPLELDVADDGGFHQAAQQPVARDLGEVRTDPAARPRGKRPRPGLDGARDAAPIASSCLTRRAATGASSLARPHGSDSARIISERKSSTFGRHREHLHALNEQRLGLRRLGDRERAPQRAQRIVGLPERHERARRDCCRRR